MTSLKQVRRIVSVVTLAAIVGFAGCSKKQKVKPDELTNTSDVADAALSTGDSDSGTASGLQTVYFPFDSYTLPDKAKMAVRANAEILKTRDGLKIQIEGHCDERGGIQYNIALGEKRAKAVENMLIDMGVSGARIETVSYGKERPIAQGSNEEAWAKNRRANFVLTK